MLQIIKISLDKLDPDVDAEAFLSQVEQVSELLVKRDGDIYQFSHLSFQEFLAAAEIVRLKEDGERLIFNCLGVSAWKDLILFYAGLVNPTKLIQEAVNLKQTGLADLIYSQTHKRPNLSFAERKSLDGLKEIIKTSRYQQLEEHLKAKQWIEADYETYRLMITAIGKDEGQAFSEDNLRNFPCDEILAIDRMWIKYSNGIYGFSIQKQIYVECGGKQDFDCPSYETWDKFCNNVAWKDNKRDYYMKDYSGFLNEKVINRAGHFPILWGFGVWRFGSKWGIIFSNCDL